ncbi:MAG: hypothetical protein F4X57_05715 [Chloroflexi bacterium]|nr:hypothetical protein [Chloroflexota bacterium]
MSSLRRLLTHRVLLIAILAVALALRFYGLAWDAGFSYTPHPDERAILDRVIGVSPPALGDIRLLFDAEQSPWNPRWFNYGSFPLYVLKAVQIADAPFLDDANDIRVLGRAVSGLADILTILAVYGIATLVFDRRTGLLAAALTALAVIHIQLSHYFAVDTLQAMLAIAALYFMVRVAREGRLRDSLLAGALIGLGLATKASQLPIIAPFVIAHLMFALALNGSTLNGSTHTDNFETRLRTALRGVVGGGAMAVVALLIAQPYTLLDWSTFFTHVSEQSEMIRGIRDYPYTRQYSDTLPYLYHIRQLAVWGYGLPLGVAAWAGLLYISLRGMPLKIGVAYLLVGWVLPAGILFVSHGAVAVAAAAGISLLALLATLPVRSKHTQIEVLLLCWVVPYLIVTGGFHVKFMRYMLPIAPLLTLFGARLLWTLWDAANDKSLLPRWGKVRMGVKVRLQRFLIGALIALILAGTAFYALAYLNGVYGQTHTAVRASEWLNRSAPQGATVLKEHWEESLPNQRRDFRFGELPMYENDRYAKTALIAESLADADYLVLFSNRLYGTIPRLPERYPISTAYYNLLFAERLGYTLENVQTSYPEMFGIAFVDDTLDRPSLPAPAALQRHTTAPIALNLGWADESFSVYDHPKVLIFRNTGRLGAEEIQRLIEQSAPSDAYDVPARERQSSLGLVYSPEDLAIQQSGGTWTSIIHTDSWTNRLPVLAWLGVLELIALVTLPLTFVVFRPLSDRGYLFGKALGLLLVGLIVWLLASTQLAAFSRQSIVLAMLLLGMASLGVFAVRGNEIIDFVRMRWRALVVAEVVFIAAFLVFVLVRMANPDLWHPFRGGEKPMDFAYLNAVLRSTIMPPYDPWFGGGYLNYYYWGQFLTALLVRATAIEPVVAFNLAVPTFFALTVGGVYTIVYNLVRSASRRLDESMGILSSAPRWSPVLMGLVGVAFVVVLGNLDGAIQVWHGAGNVLSGQPFGEFDFWRSSRMMPPDPPGHEITEFPFFTFLFADLHAHLMAIPFTVLVLGLSLAVVLSASESSKFLPPRWGKVRMGVSRIASAIVSVGTLRLAILGIAVGSLAPLNTWDLPTYLIIAAAAITFAEFLSHGGLTLLVLLRAGVKTALVVVVGFAAFLPYHLAGETFYNSVESTTNTTVLWQFLAISGLFVFIIGAFAVDELAEGVRGQFAALRRKFGRLYDVLDGEEAAPVSVGWLIAVISGALLVGLALTAAFTGVVGSTVPFVFALAVLLAAVGVGVLLKDRPDGAQLGFVLMLALVSLSLVVGLDFLRVEGDIDRLNSIFKFYLQVWVMLGIASAYLLWRLFRAQRSFLARMPSVRQAWKFALAVLVLSAAIYPALGTQDRLRDRFEGYVTPLTLNGIAFMEGSSFREHNGELIDLATDSEGIRWLQRNVQGSPIVLEAVTPSYRWAGRVSMYTGLPSVIGWQWHQEQQRAGYAYEVGRRTEAVRTIYSTQDAAQALALMRTYNVKYVYLGRLERIYFPEGMAKFADNLGGALDKVFDNGETAIYRVRDGV